MIKEFTHNVSKAVAIQGKHNSVVLLEISTENVKPRTLLLEVVQVLDDVMFTTPDLPKLRLDVNALNNKLQEFHNSKRYVLRVHLPSGGIGRKSNIKLSDSLVKWYSEFYYIANPVITTLDIGFAERFTYIK